MFLIILIDGAVSLFHLISSLFASLLFLSFLLAFFHFRFSACWLRTVEAKAFIHEHTILCVLFETIAFTLDRGSVDHILFLSPGGFLVLSCLLICPSFSGSRLFDTLQRDLIVSCGVAVQTRCISFFLFYFCSR